MKSLKLILSFLFLMFSVNVVAEDNKVETKKTLTLEEIYEKYGNGQEARDYIKKNELYHLLEERDKKAV